MFLILLPGIFVFPYWSNLCLAASPLNLLSRSCNFLLSRSVLEAWWDLGVHFSPNIGSLAIGPGADGSTTSADTLSCKAAYNLLLDAHAGPPHCIS